MDQYMNETIGVKLPTGQHVELRLPVKYTEDDSDIALRTARNFPPGTVIKVDGNSFKVLSQDPPEITELKSARSSSLPESEPKSERGPSQELQIGQRWVTKDSRRKQEPFEVISIEDDFVLTDKGLRIQVKRLSRYKLVS
jgi:hypothetical protein